MVQKEHLLQSLLSKSRLIDGSQSIRVKRKSLDLLENPDLMDYPLIGSVPTSVIYDLKKLDDKSITTETQLHGDNYIEQTLPTEEDIEASEEKIVDQNDDKKIPAAPYSSHPRGHAGRNRGLASLLGSQKDLSVDTTMSNGLRKHSSDELEDLNTSSQTLPTISSDTISLNSIPDSIKLSKSQSMDSLGDYESEQSEPESTVIPSRSNGIIIRKKLRQKGISIVVGSSSSSEGKYIFKVYSIKRKDSKLRLLW